MDSPAGRRDDPPSITLANDVQIVIQAFPHDTNFVRDIGRALTQVRASATSESQLLVALRGALRMWYPRIEIQPRNPLAGLIAEEHVWYALRDGRVRRANDQANRLHAAMANARQTSADSEVAVERARAAMNYANQPRSRHREAVVPSGAGPGPDDEPQAANGDDEATP